jgi:hypothetical protein
MVPKKEEKLSALDKAQINELLSQSIGNYVKTLKNDAKEISDSIEMIDGYISEYLQAFIVFGYDMKGHPVCIHHATNQMDSDALNCLVNRILFNRGE